MPSYDIVHDFSGRNLSGLENNAKCFILTDIRPRFTVIFRLPPSVNFMKVVAVFCLFIYL